jgi:uridine kinase
VGSEDVVSRLASYVRQQTEAGGTGFRVAIDGKDAAGKTTLADQLATVLVGGPAEIVRAGIDGWHNPEAVRFKRGRLSPEGYYLDAFDLPHLRRELLDPLGPTGSHEYRLAGFNYQADAGVDEGIRQAHEPYVLIFDGVFLLRPELADCWELSIYVSVPPDVSIQRGVERDSPLMGGIQEAADRYRRRYLPGQALYEAEVSPTSIANVVVDNTDFEHPMIIKFPGLT